MNIENESSFGSATRVLAGDDGTRYDPVAISLHWLTALLVVCQFALAETWGMFGRGTRHMMITTHMSFGIILTAVIVARIIWRLIPGHQVSSTEVGWVRIASKSVHYILYVLLAFEAVLGFTLRWSGGEAMSFFGLQIPSPLGHWSRSAHHLVGDLHNWNGWAIILIAFGHALAALYHHYVLHDRVLRRMLPGSA
jgi:cytochrome b561